MIKKIINWVVVSSENPQNVSLTLRGILIGAIPVVISVVPTVAGLFGIHFTFTSENLSLIFNNIANLAGILLTIAGSCISGYGLMRKIVNSVYDLVIK
jgi:hypothetical protein